MQLSENEITELVYELRSEYIESDLILSLVRLVAAHVKTLQDEGFVDNKACPKEVINKWISGHINISNLGVDKEKGIDDD